MEKIKSSIIILTVLIFSVYVIQMGEEDIPRVGQNKYIEVHQHL